MIRLIILLLDFLLLAVASVITFPLSRVIGWFSKNAKDHFCLRFIQLAMKSFVFYGGVKIHYKGLEYLPKDGEAVVYIGNHRGFYDIVATYIVMPDLTGFIAKKEMKSWPLIGWWMNSVYCLFLDREDKREGLKTILQGIEYIKNGVSMAIYPEGTRSHTEGVLCRFHAGSFKLATKPKVKIIPVVSNNSGAIFDDHRPWVHGATMSLEFCEPIDTASLTRAELEALPDRVRDIIQERVIANGIELGSLPADFRLPEETPEE